MFKKVLGEVCYEKMIYTNIFIQTRVYTLWAETMVHFYNFSGSCRMHIQEMLYEFC